MARLGKDLHMSTRGTVRPRRTPDSHICDVMLPPPPASPTVAPPLLSLLHPLFHLASVPKVLSDSFRVASTCKQTGAARAAEVSGVEQTRGADLCSRGDGIHPLQHRAGFLRVDRIRLIDLIACGVIWVDAPYW